MGTSLVWSGCLSSAESFLCTEGLKPKEMWDVGEPSPTLQEVLALKPLSAKFLASRGIVIKSEPQRSLGDCKGKRALIPGCGRAYDAIALAEYGFDSGLEKKICQVCRAGVIAIDLSPSAVEAAKKFLKESGASSKIEAFH